MKLSLPQPNPHCRLGFLDTVFGAAAKAAEGILGPGPGSRPAAVPGVAVPGGAVAPGTAMTPQSGPITVSPAIQTQVSPQISPVMTMQQDSPGAQVTAAPQQRGGGGQTAMPGGPAFPPIPGAYPGSDYGDWAGPAGRGPAFPEAFPEPYTPVVRTGESDTAGLLKTGILAAGVIGAMMVLNRPKRPKK